MFNVIKKSSLLLNTLKLSSSNILMYLLPIVVTPILTRLYSPQDFGEWGVFSSFVSIVSVGMFLCLENAIVKSKSIEDVTSMCVLCLFSGCGITCIILFVFYIGQICYVSFAIDFPSLLLLALYLFTYIVYTILYNLYNRAEKYSTLSVCNVVQGSSQAFFRLLFAVVTCTAVNGLILGTVIAQFLSVTFLLFFFKKYVVLAKVSFGHIKKTLVSNKQFLLYDTPSSILSFAAFNLPLLILSVYFGKEEIGCFSIILQLLLVPMALWGSSMSKVYYQQLCSARCDNDSFMTEITYKVLRLTAVISIIPMSFLVLGGDHVVVSFLGEKWKTAGQIALCLSIWSFPILLTQPILPLFRFLNKIKELFLYEFFYFLISIGLLLCGCYITDSLMNILCLYSCGSLIVKMSLLLRILQECKLKLSMFRNSICIWCLVFGLLIFRLIDIK